MGGCGFDGYGKSWGDSYGSDRADPYGSQMGMGMDMYSMFSMMKGQYNAMMMSWKGMGKDPYAAGNVKGWDPSGGKGAAWDSSLKGRGNAIADAGVWGGSEAASWAGKGLGGLW